MPTLLPMYVANTCTVQASRNPAEQAVANMDGPQVMSKKHCHIIDHNMGNLCRLIILDGSLWGLLVSRGIFRTSDRDYINEVSTGQRHDGKKEDAVFELLASLQKKPDICYYKFVECLKEAGQDSAAELLTERSTKRYHVPSQSPLRRNPSLNICVSKHYHLLMETLSEAPWRFYYKLVSRDIIDKAFIRQYTSADPDLKARRLIDIICELGDRQFQGFIHALEFIGYTSLAETLKHSEKEARRELIITNSLKEHINKHYRQLKMICRERCLDVQQVYTPPVIRNTLSENTLTHYTDIIMPDSKRTLLTGRRGSGKTALVCMLLNHWLKASEEESTYINHRFKKFKYVFPLDFSNINLHDSLLYLLKTQLGLESEAADFLVECIREDPGAILLIFDNVKTSSFALSEFERRLLSSNSSDVSIIYVCRDSEYKHSGNLCQRFELIGFSEEGVQQYVSNIYRFLDEKKNVRTLESTLILLGRNPSYLQIILYLREERGDINLTFIFLNILGYVLFDNFSPIIYSELECEFFLKKLFKFRKELGILGREIIFQIACSDKLVIYVDTVTSIRFYHILEQLPVNIENTDITFSVPPFKYFLAAIHLFLSRDPESISKLFNNIYEDKCKYSLHVLEICSHLEDLTPNTEYHIHDALIRYIAERNDYWTYVEYTMTWPTCFKTSGEIRSNVLSMQDLHREIECFEEIFVSTDSSDPAIVDVKKKIVIMLLSLKDTVWNHKVREIKLKGMSDFSSACWLLTLRCFSELEILEINCSFVFSGVSKILVNTLCLLDKLKSLKLCGLIYTEEHNVIESITRLRNLEHFNLEVIQGGNDCNDVIGTTILNLTKLVSIHLSFSEKLAAIETSGILSNLTKSVEPRITELGLENIVMDLNAMINFEKLIEYLKHLDNLSISKCEFEGLEKRRFFVTIGRAISLESLKLGDIWLGAEDIKTLFEALHLLKRLQKLVLINLKFLSISSCREFSEGLHTLRDLVGLTLISKNKSHTGICNFITSKNLEELFISDSICEVPSSFYTQLSTFYNLHTFSLVRVYLGSPGFLHVKEILLDLPALTCLNLSHCGGSDIVLNESFTKHLYMNPSLKVFNVTGNKSDPDGFRYLVMGLQRCTKLVELGLGGCGCKDSEVMTSLIDCITKLDSLEILNLSGNRINKEGFIKLSAAFKHTQKLRWLSLNKCEGKKEYNSGLIITNLDDIPDLEQLYLSKTCLGQTEARILPEKLSKLKQLKILDLSYSRNLIIQTIPKIINSLHKCLLLESIILDGIVKGKKAFSELTSVIQNLQFLKKLSLNDSACLDEAMMGEFINVLGRCRNLQSVSLSRTNISKLNMRLLAKSFSLWRKLSKINLSGSCNTYSARILLEDLSHTSMEELNLSSCLLSGKGFNTLSNVLPGFRSLRILCLNRCGCTDPDAFAALVNSLIALNRLQLLDLSCNTAGKLGTISLAKTIKRLPCLIRLNISNTSLVCEENFFQSLSRCCLLERLDLSCNMFPSNGFQRLAAHIKNLRRLEYLSLKYCGHADRKVIQYFKMCNVKKIDLI